MQLLDWILLISTLFLIMAYGIYRSRGQRDLKGYFLGDNTMSWYKVMFSVMATQASAITFLSAPGLAFTDGMRFVQYYLGMPLAIVVVTAVFVPVYHRLKVMTAYEFLEQKFDVRVRVFTAFLFLLQRGLAAGLTIFAPALVMSTLLGWDIYLTCSVMGILVIVYTLSGGAKAVAYTQLQQMIVILGGMAFAGVIVYRLLPQGVGFVESLEIAGKAGRMNVLVTKFDWADKYNVWSGLLGGFFLSLSYFGTDQSQVGRYLGAKSIKESTTGLLMNAVVKIPMQFGVLLIGIALFVFYVFNPQPLTFNSSLEKKIYLTDNADKYAALQTQFDSLQKEQAASALAILSSTDDSEVFVGITHHFAAIDSMKSKVKTQANELIKDSVPGADTKDTNYIFLYFVLRHLPVGLIGLLLAVIFSASWSSTSSELNALAGTFVVDFYKRLFRKEESEKHYVIVSKIATAFWGILAILFAFLATRLDTLIEAVNLLGSLFYGTILGVFLTAFLPFKIKAKAVLIAAILTELGVILLYYNDVVGFLWLNPIGALSVVSFSVLINEFVGEDNNNLKNKEV